MRRLVFLAAAAAVVVLGLAPRAARAMDTVVPPGGTLDLQEDLVLQPGDSLMLGGPGPTPCVVTGNGHVIKTAPEWKGTATISNCTVTGLGTALTYGLDLMSPTEGDLTIEDNTFDACGALHLVAGGTTTASFRRNTIPETTLVPTVVPLSGSRPVIEIDGPGGKTPKYFQGNRIDRSWIVFHQVENWLIGGDTPADSNIIIGSRAGIFIDLSNDMIIRGNFVHLTSPFNGWNQVASFESVGTNLLVEHNVVTGGNWLVRGLSGSELRYNLFGDSFERPWLGMSLGDTWSVHHNIFVRNDRGWNDIKDIEGLGIGPPADGMPVVETDQVFNNTLDGGGPCRAPTSGAISMGIGAMLPSLRNNAIVHFRSDMGEATAMVHGERMAGNTSWELPEDPPAPRLAYADYNLFYDPDSARKDNYAVGVEGKAERMEDGFALHDVPAGGTIDQQVDPKFTGPIPYGFPFSDDDLRSGAATVCQVLAYYRQIYSPAAGSPLTDSGDPADGEGTDIGAVGSGVEKDDDLFGKLCPDGDIGTPSLPPEIYKCTVEQLRYGPGKPGPDSGANVTPGFACVCAAGDAGGRSGGLGLACCAALAAGALRARRRRGPPQT